jgi:putative adenylate-forming enzyme
MIGRVGDVVAFLITFVRHRWGYRFKDRRALLDYQQRRIARLLKRRSIHAPFYRAHRDTPFTELPIVGKEDVLSSFAHFNVCGISLASARAHAFRAERNRDFGPTLAGNISVGSSSGTSGQPSIFLVSQRERMLWAGAMLGRMLSPVSLRRLINPFSRPLRIAFFLRANSNLYTSLDSIRVQFVFFDLARSLESHFTRLSSFMPDILVAPASVLRHLAERQKSGIVDVRPGQVISVAERLEEEDAQVIASAWDSAPRQIYQCTEGFLGFTCAKGSIHLNEESVHFEPQWQDAERRRFTAVLTDFQRRTQLFVRYRMDDLLRVHPDPCGCGRVTLRLESIEGRQDEILWLPGVALDALQPIFPDQVRHSIMLGSPTCGDYRLEQHGMLFNLAVRGQDTQSHGLQQIAGALVNLCMALNVRPPTIRGVDWVTPLGTEKRRRIRCLSRPSQDSQAGPLPLVCPKVESA